MYNTTLKGHFIGAPVEAEGIRSTKMYRAFAIENVDKIEATEIFKQANSIEIPETDLEKHLKTVKSTLENQKQVLVEMPSYSSLALDAKDLNKRRQFRSEDIFTMTTGVKSDGVTPLDLEISGALWTYSDRPYEYSRLEAASVKILW